MTDPSGVREEFDVGGVRLPRPFKLLRLGHFGVNVEDAEVSRDFYTRLIGFRVSDPIDFGMRLPEAERGQHGKGKNMSGKSAEDIYLPVPPGTEVPEGSVIMGVPGKVVATRDNLLATRRNALIYHRNALAYAEGRHDAWRGDEFARWREDIVRRLTAGEEVGV